MNRDNIDCILVEQTLKGDSESFTILVETYQHRLYGFLLKLTLSREDAEEILQEVFIKAYNYLYKYNSNWSFSTWIFKIAVNTFKTEYKKRRKNRHVCYSDIPEELCCPDDCPEITFETKEQYMGVLKLVDQLKPEQKIPFMLKHVKGHSYKEVGDILGISPEAAKMRVQRAKETLGRHFMKMRKGGWMI